MAPKQSSRKLPIAASKKPFNCDTCGKRFNHSSDLKRHLRLHTGERPYKCEICSQKFTQSGSLNLHMRIHTGERPFKCDTCGHRFTRLDNLKAHLRTHTGEKPYKCDICGGGFTFSFSLKVHMRRVHTAGGEPKRLLAKPSSSTRSRRLLSFSSCSESEEEMDQCQMNTTVDDDSKQYINISDTSIDDGDLSTAALQTLAFEGDGGDDHNGATPDMVMDNMDNDGIVVGNANIGTTTAKNEGKETEQYNNEDNNKGDGEQQKQPQDNIIDGKESSSRKFIKCFMAPTKASRKLQTAAPFKCNICGKRCTQLGNLKTHMRTHTGEQPYKCEKCGKRFTQSSHLKTHLRVHTGERPFKCDKCGKRFSQSGDLKRHLRIHTGEKLFKCDKCGKRFSQSGDLKRHLRTHNGERPFKCGTRGKKFTVSGTLKKQMYRKHNGETKPELLLANDRSAAAESDEEMDQCQMNTTVDDDSKQYINNSDTSIDDDDLSPAALQTPDMGMDNDSIVVGSANIGTITAKNKGTETEHYNNGDNNKNDQQKQPQDNIIDGEESSSRCLLEAIAGNSMATSQNTKTTYGNINSADEVYSRPQFAPSVRPTNFTKLRIELDKIKLMLEQGELEHKLEAERMCREEAEKMDLGKMRAELMEAEQMAVEAKKEMDKLLEELKFLN